MKKIVSLVMAVILTLGAPLFTFADEGYNKEPLDLVQNVTDIVNINGEVVLKNTVSASKDNTSIEFISNNNTLTTVVDNEVFVNGSSVAKIEETTTDINGKQDSQDAALLATIYSDTPVYGAPSDYVYYSTVNGTLILPNILIAIGQYALTEAILVVVALYKASTRIAGFVLAMLPLAFQSSNALYYTKHTYKHNTLPGFYWADTYDWYFDSPRTIYIESETVYAGRA